MNSNQFWSGLSLHLTMFFSGLCFYNPFAAILAGFWLIFYIILTNKINNQE